MRLEQSESERTALVGRGQVPVVLGWNLDFSPMLLGSHKRFWVRE